MTLKQGKDIKSPNESNSPKYSQAGEKVKEKDYQGATECFSLTLLVKRIRKTSSVCCVEWLRLDTPNRRFGKYLRTLKLSIVPDT